MGSPCSKPCCTLNLLAVSDRCVQTNLETPLLFVIPTKTLRMRGSEMQEMAEARQALRLVTCEERDGSSKSQRERKRGNGRGVFQTEGGGEGGEKAAGRLGFRVGPERMI